MRIHFVHIDYSECFDDQDEATREIVFKLNNRAIQTTRNSFIYFNEYDYTDYLDDLFSDIDTVLRDSSAQENYFNYFISNLSIEELKYQFDHLMKECEYIFSKIKL